MNRNNRQRAPRRRNNNNGRPRTLNAPSLDANRTVKRTFNSITTLNLSSVNPNGGTERYFNLAYSLSEFPGSENTVKAYEQYRFEKIEIWMRTSLQNVAGLTGQAKYSGMYSAVNSTRVDSFIDYDTDAPPTNSAQITSRDQLSSIALQTSRWTKVAAYVPRARLSDASNSLPALVLPNASSWISTQFDDIEWLGLRGGLYSDGDQWGTSSSTSLKIEVFCKVAVACRGLRTNTA